MDKKELVSCQRWNKTNQSKFLIGLDKLVFCVLLVLFFLILFTETYFNKAISIIEVGFKLIIYLLEANL